MYVLWYYRSGISECGVLSVGLAAIPELLFNCMRESNAILYLFWIIWTAGCGSENVG